MTVEIYIKERQITRLCHFTKSVSLPYIFRSDVGIKSVRLLENEGFEVKKNDLNRYDGRPNYLSCSIQYPNMYYFEKIKNRDQVFKEWVIILLDPMIMGNKETLFCQTNAAYNKGRHLKYGMEGLIEMFVERNTVGNYLQSRSNHMPKNVPTNAQAEVMIYNNIPVSNIIGIICPNIEQAKRELNRFKQLQIPITFDILYSDEIFQKNFFLNIKQGFLPKEVLFHSYKGELW